MVFCINPWRVLKSPYKGRKSSVYRIHRFAKFIAFLHVLSIHNQNRRRPNPGRAVQVDRASPVDAYRYRLCPINRMRWTYYRLLVSGSGCMGWHMAWHYDAAGLPRTFKGQTSDRKSCSCLRDRSDCCHSSNSGCRWDSYIKTGLFLTEDKSVLKEDNSIVSALHTTEAVRYLSRVFKA
jgi:hypothetical protein